jgi:uncharacterized peroxidase-related enzyme
MAAEYRMTLAPRTLENASPEERAVLNKAKAQVGFIPNMYGVMVNSPGLLETYLDGYDRFRRDSGFTPAEQEVVFLTISRDSGCEYCTAAHTMLADKVSKVPPAVTDAILSGAAIPDPKLAALSAFTSRLLESRGLPTRAEVQAFLGTGYSERQLLEVILALAVKTLSNFANHLFHTPIDDMFADDRGTKAA